MSKEEIELKVLNPRGEIEPPPIFAPAPRVTDLEGKKIALIHNKKAGADTFLDAVQELLQAKYPTATFSRDYTTEVNLAREPAFYDEIAQAFDAFIFGSGDWGTCTWWGSYHTAELEKRGLPGAYFVSSNFMSDARSAASDWGMPALRTVSLPSDRWYTLRRNLDELRPVAEDAIDTIIDILTRPLTAEEANPPREQKEDIESAEFVISGDSYPSALEKFNDLFLENRMGDGLPLVPPNPERVAWMLSGTSRVPEEVLGKCPLKLGTVTIEKIAINVVMAGAKPEYLPVIIGAMECFVGESGPGQKGEFFFHTLGSSGAFNLVIMVNGPIAKEINMNYGMGLFGHGWRANNTIGRAVRLSTLNIGHCWPRVNDMALVGRASAHTWYTFAENEDASYWEPYHVYRGYTQSDSTVTVSKVNSIYATFGGGAVGLWTAESILDQVSERIGRGATYIVFNPEVHVELNKLGFNRQSV